MESVAKTQRKKRDIGLTSVYSRCLITRNINIPINAVDKNIKQTIEETISEKFEGKCLVEGYVKPNSCVLLTYSSGLVERGINILFEVVFECKVCYLVEGSLVSCIAKNITKAGIRAESADEVPSPVVVFIARDHQFNSQYFATIKEGDKFNVRVIGQRFELNDKYVSIIGELLKPKPDFVKGPSKPKLVFED